jgi:hypothetical protein
MNTIGSLPPVSYVSPRVARVDGTLGANVATSFPSLLKTQSEPRPSSSGIANTQRQPESVMSMARRPNVEAMLQQLIAYGKKHLCIDKTERPAHSTSALSSLILDCELTGNSAAADHELLNQASLDGRSMDLCIQHIHDANAWMADFCGNSSTAITPAPWTVVPLPALFVWVWVPIEQTRTPTLFARPRRRPRIPAVGDVRSMGVVSDSDEG